MERFFRSFKTGWGSSRRVITTYFTLERAEAPPATSRHTRHLLWLLPSGPDQVHKLVLREDQWSLHRLFVSLARTRWIMY